MGAGLSLLASIAVPLGMGVAGSITTMKEVKGWYTTIKKPSWTPPVSVRPLPSRTRHITCQSALRRIFARTAHSRITGKITDCLPVHLCHRTGCLAPLGPPYTPVWAQRRGLCSNREVRDHNLNPFALPLVGNRYRTLGSPSLNYGSTRTLIARKKLGEN
eukprot:6497471-Pyramimonas_sp.AAC.1